jgi:predicted small metal-binding protein
MLTRILLATLVVALMVTFVSSASAQAAKKEAKKMTAELKSVSCDPQCGFMVQSHDEKELTDIVIAHAKKAHNMDITANDVKAKIKSSVMAKKSKS